MKMTMSHNRSAHAKQRVGRVWIIGAGPGDPDLLTLKARRLLDEAEVIYYDALVNSAIIEGVDAECIFVGKRRGFRLFEQEEINGMMASSARAGHTVVRLKGGDPFIFGRGGEELRYLTECGIECGVVPGISAAFAGAASLGLPLTYRGVASSFAICTGAPAESIASPIADTTAYYMAARSLREILRKAIAEGLSTEARVALVHNASLPDERRWFRSAGELVGGSEEFPSPLIVFIGAVVELSEERSAVDHESPWYEQYLIF